MQAISIQEKIEMILIYGESGRNIDGAVALYAQRFPDQIRSRTSFYRVIQQFTGEGSVQPKKRNQSDRVAVEDNEIAVLAAVGHDLASLLTADFRHQVECLCQSNYSIHKADKMSSSCSRADPIALSFNDTLLRVSDIQLLQGPHWLNDQILSFYFEYLETLKYKTNNDLLFVSPEVTQCMKMMDDEELEALLQQLNADRKPFIFFVLNDNESYRAGGTHWSLLVFSRPEHTFFHFDSLGNLNQDTMHQFVNRIKDVLNCRNCHMKPIRCLQQSNSYDCGIHVLCMTDNIADYVNRFECVDGVGPLHHDTISAKRSELLKLIASLGGKV